VCVQEARSTIIQENHRPGRHKRNTFVGSCRQRNCYFSIPGKAYRRGPAHGCIRRAPPRPRPIATNKQLRFEREGSTLQTASLVAKFSQADTIVARALAFFTHGKVAADNHVAPPQPCLQGLESYRVMLPRMSIHVKGTTGLIIAAVVVVAVLIAWPSYRIFFGISLGIGIIVAGILYLRNKYRPVDEKDVENKRPLGLD
jgi:hypothetical protein